MARLEDPTLMALVDSLWDRSIPVNLLSIAKKLGIEIEDLADNQEPDVSGEAFIRDKFRKVIRFNTKDVKERQRFTLAHEIGHHLLGHTKSGKKFRDNTGNFNSSVFDWQEYSANAFAAELLMPESAINYFIQKKNISDIRKLAEIFEVSQIAMKYRLMNLGWL